MNYYMNKLCPVSVMLSCLFNAALWSPAGERVDLLALLCVVLLLFHFPMWCPGSGVVLNCIGL